MKLVQKKDRSQLDPFFFFWKRETNHWLSLIDFLNALAVHVQGTHTVKNPTSTVLVVKQQEVAIDCESTWHVVSDREEKAFVMSCITDRP